ncbi:MAG: rhomboid family intramembrane serine protease [Bradymonadales bacterium]|jgi:membrane associated rhomboid family serine protease
MQSSSPYKTCSACQAFVPIHDPRCPFCDARQMPAWEWRFYKTLQNIVPKSTPATKILLVVIIIFFLLMSVDVMRADNFAFSQLLMSPPMEILWRWGAHVRGEFEPWRLIMANFVHIGLIHILFNASALRAVGPWVERYFGSAMTLASFIILGTASMACSNVLGTPSFAAGASGGLMAFVGMIATAARRDKTASGRKISQAMFMSAAFVMIFGFIISVSGTMGIDNIAHGSGFILGCIAGAVLPIQGFTGYTKLWPTRLAAILLVIGTASLAWSTSEMLMESQSLRLQNACISAIKEIRPASAALACEKAYRQDSKNFANINNLVLAYRMTGEIQKADELCELAKSSLTAKQYNEIAVELCPMK